MSDNQFFYYLRKILPALLISLLICLTARIVFAAIYSSEQKAKEDHPSIESGEPQQSAEESNSETEPEQSSTDTDSSPTDNETETTAPSGDVILGETPDAGQEYIDKIVFLGDSTTYGLSYYGIVRPDQVWTGANDEGDGTNGTLSLYLNTHNTKIYYPDESCALTIGEAAAKKKPEYLVITLGLNGGVGDYFEEKQFKASYRKIIESVQANSPDTKIILQNIFPVAPNIDSEKYPTITNSRINLANVWVLDLAKEYGLKYLDSRAALTDADGNMKLEYQSGDGIHMTPDALRSLIVYMRTHACE